MRVHSHGRISRRVFATLPPIMQVMKGLKKGDNVIDLSQGVPFFDPPVDSIRKALADLEGLHRYGKDNGDSDLREEVSKKLHRSNGIDADPRTRIMITSGANLGFFNAAAALCDVGDEMILLDPFYFNHRMTLDILGIKSIHVSTDSSYLPVPEVVDKAIGPKTKAVVIVSPNNPTGRTYPSSIVKEILEICIDHNIFLVSDETYEGYDYSTSHYSPALEGPETPVVSLFSMSKNYALSGWRIGYMVFPSFLFESVMKVQDTTVICPSRISQRVALQCLRDYPDHLARYMGDFRRSRDMVISWLHDNESSIRCHDPDGAYYVFPGINSHNRFHGSMELVKEILERTGVLLVPGGPFGMDVPPHFRLSYGNIRPEVLEEALARLGDFFQHGFS